MVRALAGDSTITRFLVMAGECSIGSCALRGLPSRLRSGFADAPEELGVRLEVVRSLLIAGRGRDARLATGGLCTGRLGTRQLAATGRVAGIGLDHRLKIGRAHV